MMKEVKIVKEDGNLELWLGEGVRMLSIKRYEIPLLRDACNKFLEQYKQEDKPKPKKLKYVFDFPIKTFDKDNFLQECLDAKENDVFWINDITFFQIKKVKGEK